MLCLKLRLSMTIERYLIKKTTIIDTQVRYKCTLIACALLTGLPIDQTWCFQILNFPKGVN